MADWAIIKKVNATDYAKFKLFLKHVTEYSSQWTLESDYTGYIGIMWFNDSVNGRWLKWLVITQVNASSVVTWQVSLPTLWLK